MFWERTFVWSGGKEVAKRLWVPFCIVVRVEATRVVVWFVYLQCRSTSNRLGTHLGFVLIHLLFIQCWFKTLFLSRMTCTTAITTIQCYLGQVANEFANRLGYTPAVVCCYRDMSPRDLFMRRSTDEKGNTQWETSAVVTAALEGKVRWTFKFFVIVLNHCRESVALCCSYLFMVLDA